jgi:hypothetical protein
VREGDRVQSRDSEDTLIMQMTPIMTSQTEHRTVKPIALDSRFAALIKRIMQLDDGRFMLTLTKDSGIIDLTVTRLGSVEKIK